MKDKNDFVFPKDNLVQYNLHQMAAISTSNADKGFEADNLFNPDFAA